MNGQQPPTRVRTADIHLIDAPDCAPLPLLHPVLTVAEVAHGPSLGARTAALVVLGAFLALIVPVNGRAEPAEVATSCTCFAFEDVNGRPLQLLLLRNAPIVNGRISFSVRHALAPHPGVLGLAHRRRFRRPLRHPYCGFRCRRHRRGRKKGWLGNIRPHTSQ